MPLVDVGTREYDGLVVVTLDGALDVVDAARVAAALAEAAACGRELIVDMTGLVFIDSSGVAALLHARKQARVTGGEVLLVAPQRQVLRYLTLTGLTDVFRVCASVDEAAGGSRPVRAAVSVTARRTGYPSWPWNALRRGRRAAGGGVPSTARASQQART